MTDNLSNIESARIELDEAKAKFLEEIGDWDENREFANQIAGFCFDEPNSNFYSLLDYVRKIDRILHA